MPSRLRRSLAAWVPRWWAGRAGVAGRVADVAFWPAEQLYRGAIAGRNTAYERGWLPAERAPIPVVSVGNLGVGGAGKTPFAAWLARRLHEAGARPAVVLRGYGGDEVLLHTELNPELPVYTAAHRADAVRAAAAEGCTVAVVDDGFQHRALARDLDVVLVSAESWTVRRRLLPRGPWRESASALHRAGCVGVTVKSAGPGAAERVAAEAERLAGGVPTLVIELRPAHLAPLHAAAPREPLEWLRGRTVLAVAALADPRPFADNLRSRGAVVELVAFPDHHAFSAGDAARLLARAGERPLVTTHKDAVKLRALLPPAASVYVLHQDVCVTRGAERLDAALRDLLGRKERG